MIYSKAIALLLIFMATAVHAEEVANSGPSLDFQAGLSTLNAKLDGEGFSTDVGGDQGLTYGADISYGWASGFRLHLKYSQAGGKFDAPTGTTPASIDATRTEYMLAGTFSPWESGRLSKLRVGAGYGMVNYVVDESSPVVVTSQYSRGISAMAQHDFDFSEKWGLGLKALFYMPHAFNEKEVTTGTNPKYWGQELSAQVNWQLKEDLRVYVAMVYRTDTIRFDGTGTRGVTAATDTRTMMLYPVGLKLDF